MGISLPNQFASQWDLPPTITYVRVLVKLIAPLGTCVAVLSMNPIMTGVCLER